MSLRSIVNGFLDKITDARFKRDSQVRLIFFPMGFGSGRVVPNATIEATLRRGCRRLMIAIFVIVIPLISLANAIFEFKGIDFLALFAGSLILGFATQLYPIWLSRGLARSDERMSYAGAMRGSLDRFGKKFLIFGLATSALFTASAAFMLAYQPVRAEVDPLAMAISLLVFAPMTLIYAVALRRRCNSETA